MKYEIIVLKGTFTGKKVEMAHITSEGQKNEKFTTQEFIKYLENYCTENQFNLASISGNMYHLVKS